jgi:mannosyltransferase
MKMKHVQNPELIIFNIKKRFSGVSATVNSLLPIQKKQWRLAYCGSALPNEPSGINLFKAIKISKFPPKDRPFRIWHVRRDNEMIAGIFTRDILKYPIKLVFTSAAKHQHGVFVSNLINKMDAVIATSEQAASFLKNKSTVVPHGIDTNHFCPPVDKFRAWQETGLPGRYGIGNFGRIRQDKGTDVFVNAMINILPSLPDATAVIGGLCQPQHHSFKASLQRKIKKANLDRRIIFLGEIPANQIHLWYQRCLIYVACPRYEPFGLTAFEAAACECVPICTRTGAFEDLVSSTQIGQLIPTNNSQQLAQVILNLLEHPEILIDIGKNARDQVVDLFSIEKEAEKINAVYKRLYDI